MTHHLAQWQFSTVNEVEVLVCYIITTCEYCAEVLPQLEETVKSRVDSAYKYEIDVQLEQDAFHDLTISAIRVSE